MDEETAEEKYVIDKVKYSFSKPDDDCRWRLMVCYFREGERTFQCLAFLLASMITGLLLTPSEIADMGIKVYVCLFLLALGAMAGGFAIQNHRQRGKYIEKMSPAGRAHLEKHFGAAAIPSSMVVEILGATITIIPRR